MNRMENLPEELQNKIYEYVHKDKYDEVLNEMYTRYFCTIFKVGVLTPWAEYYQDSNCGGMIFKELRNDWDGNTFAYKYTRRASLPFSSHPDICWTVDNHHIKKLSQGKRDVHKVMSDAWERVMEDWGDSHYADSDSDSD